MTDKKTIKQWISREQDGLMDAQGNFASREDEGAYHILCSLDSFIDSMQKESKECMYSKDNYTDEDRKVLCDGCEEECKFNKKEEPVSDDLEYISLQYAGSHAPYDDAIDEVQNGFKDGAKWQKQKDKNGLGLLKEWFEDIAEKCEHLTSGNVSHNGKMIRGFARNCAEYIQTDLL